LQSGIIAGPHKQHRLRPIDAGYPNELPAISRDLNVIDGSCNALMRPPQARSLEIRPGPPKHPSKTDAVSHAHWKARGHPNKSNNPLRGPASEFGTSRHFGAMRSLVAIGAY